MLSRIFDTLSAATPGDPRRRQKSEEQQAAPGHLESPPLRLDDPVDVLAVLGAERGDGAVAQGVEFAADLLDLIAAQDHRFRIGFATSGQERQEWNRR